MRYLRSRHDVIAWRVNTGAMVGEHKGKRRFIRFGEPGQSDIQGYLRWDPWPLPFFLEVKRPGQHPTWAQEQFLARRRGDGCISASVSSVEDVITVLDGNRC